MENIQLLIEALEYIEDNLTEPLKTEAIADHLHCSKSTIEKLFRYINNISIRDYIIRRRMSNASREIVQNPEKSLLDIAVEYGYGSNEAFSRAFYNVWQVSPSEFRKNPSEFQLFPRYKYDQELIWEGKEIPLSLYVKMVRYEGGTALRYSEFFTMLQNELSEEYKRLYG